MCYKHSIFRQKCIMGLYGLSMDLCNLPAGQTLSGIRSSLCELCGFILCRKCRVVLLFSLMGNWFDAKTRGGVFGIWSANASAGNIVGGSAFCFVMCHY